MVWSPIIGVGAPRGIGRRGGGRSRAGADWLLDELELVHGNGDIMLAHTEEAAYTNNHGAHLAVLVQDQLIDVAELFVGLVVNVEAHELGHAPFTLEHHLFGTRRAFGRGWCRTIGRLSSLGIGR